MIMQKEASPNCRPGWGQALLLQPLEGKGGTGRAWGEGQFYCVLVWGGVVALTIAAREKLEGV